MLPFLHCWPVFVCLCLFCPLFVVTGNYFHCYSSLCVEPFWVHLSFPGHVSYLEGYLLPQYINLIIIGSMHKLAQGTIPLQIQALLLYGSPTVSRMSMLIIHLINLIKQLFISLFPTNTLPMIWYWLWFWNCGNKLIEIILLINIRDLSCTLFYFYFLF